ncbi:DNA cytosine methyltransferase [Pseudomonas abietaniphila]|uniref:DNA (Cytosine-5)-methyltransferase 1 n=1 Tax=Pseudomonas abietaniphila TaxID=89065 RepID=A0A1G8QYP6_9PSED|nr:DNA cytosine methyltransferase [Pseudomonas abietaniphila]SDJ09445.1 DNA (cytosine-5)-methyltransferase 1 [Pseudomonas abietaniphila]
MTTIINAKIGESKGRARVWMEGKKLSHGGVHIGSKYSIKADKVTRRLELIEVPFDFSGHSVNVSKRERNGVVHPVLDLRTDLIREVFEDDYKVRIALRRGRLVITALQIQTRIRERLKRLKEKVERGEKLATVSLFHGAGILDRAIHSGMLRSGVGSYIQVGVEMESDYLDASMRNNPHMWQENSVAIHSDVRDVYLSDKMEQCDLLIAGIPCTGASKSGRTKNKLQYAEDHDGAGALYIDYLNWLRHANPCIAIIENVGEYANTASMSAIRSVFNHLGYKVQETVLDGWDLGSLEHRKRLVVVAVTPGYADTFSLDNLKATRVRESCLNDILEPIALDDSRWKKFEYLAIKEERDKAAGKGFARQLLTGEEDGCGSVGRGYSKCRSTEPFIKHPTDSTLSRLFTAVEHTRIKAIPEDMIVGLSETVAHEVCGQSVDYPMFVSVGVEIGESIMRSRNNVIQFRKRPVEVTSTEPDDQEQDEVPKTGSLALFI